MIAAIFTAFMGYRLFKYELWIFGALLGFFIGSALLPFYLPVINTVLFDGKLSIPNLLGVACAIVFIFIINYLHALTVFALGTLMGAIVFTTVVSNFADSSVTLIVILAIFSIACGVLSLKLFRPFFITVSSAAGGIMSGYTVFKLLFEGNLSFIAFPTLFGVLIAVSGFVYQIRSNFEHDKAYYQ